MNKNNLTKLEALEHTKKHIGGQMYLYCPQETEAENKIIKFLFSEWEKDGFILPLSVDQLEYYDSMLPQRQEQLFSFWAGVRYCILKLMSYQSLPHDEGVLEFHYRFQTETQLETVKYLFSRWDKENQWIPMSDEMRDYYLSLPSPQKEMFSYFVAGFNEFDLYYTH